MSITTLDDFICVPLPIDLYNALAVRHQNSISTVLEDITWNYLERTEDDFIAKPTGGISWGRLFLPTGTQLRVKHSRSNGYGYGEVTSDNIEYLGEKISSPSQFAGKVKNNTNVNAWIKIEIKRPQDREWKLADSFR